MFSDRLRTARGGLKQKDKTIASQAESIVNLTRSLDKIVGKKRSAQK